MRATIQTGPISYRGEDGRTVRVYGDLQRISFRCSSSGRDKFVKGARRCRLRDGSEVHPAGEAMVIVATGERLTLG